jgi:hypothetical protein
MTALSSPVAGAASTNFPRSPRAPIAPRRVKRMKKSKRGSVSVSGMPVSISNWASVPFPVRASPRIDACANHNQELKAKFCTNSAKGKLQGRTAMTRPECINTKTLYGLCQNGKGVTLEEKTNTHTANPNMATRPTNSSFALVNPIPPEVPKIPSSVFSFTTCI